MTTFQHTHPSTPLEINWKPYQIDPSTSSEGELMESYCRRRWGGSGWTHHLKSEGRKCGAPFGNWKWWPNTFKAHQLIQFGEERGVDSNTSNAVIFKALYEKGQNISLISTLVDIGSTELNLPANELRQYLESDSGAEHVQNDIRTGKQRYRISGVPFFLVGRGSGGQPYAFSGAQNARTFVNVFEQVLEQDEEE